MTLTLERFKVFYELSNFLVELRPFPLEQVLSTNSSFNQISNWDQWWPHWCVLFYQDHVQTAKRTDTLQRLHIYNWKTGSHRIVRRISLQLMKFHPTCAAVLLVNQGSLTRAILAHAKVVFSHHSNAPGLTGMNPLRRMFVRLNLLQFYVKTLMLIH